MNFIDILVEIIDTKDIVLLKQFINMYKPQLVRDPQFINYLDRIAKYYFDGQTVIQANPMQQMIQNMMKGGSARPQLGGAK